MSWINLKNILFLNLIIVHSIILLLSYLKEPGSKAVILAMIITLLLLIPVIANITFGKAKTLAINSSIILVFLLLCEVLFASRIIQHPVVQVWRLTDSRNINAVEFLKEAPFVKFKPNVIVRSQGSRGNDFTYEWQTDSLGFKNIQNSDTLNSHFDYIALGDSFTEGMGVSIDDTWTSKVNQRSEIKIYNAAIRGYSASQMNATYLNIKDKISHDGIIIGALPTIFSREKIFDSYENASLGTGGIRSIASGNVGTENSFLTGLIRALKKFSSQKTLLISRDNRNYITEIPESFHNRDSLAMNIYWKKYVDNLIKLSNSALSSGKEVVLIQYPHRHEIYFETDDLGVNDIKQVDYYIELELLKEALPKNVTILDMFPHIKDAWTSDRRIMYFIKDGHMNEKGQDLVSDFIISNLNMR